MITGVDKTRELFIRLLGEAFNSPDVIQARTVNAGIDRCKPCWQSSYVLYFWRSLENLQKSGDSGSTWTGVGIGVDPALLCIFRK